MLVGVDGDRAEPTLAGKHCCVAWGLWDSAVPLCGNVGHRHCVSSKMYVALWVLLGVCQWRRHDGNRLAWVLPGSLQCVRIHPTCLVLSFEDALEEQGLVEALADAEVQLRRDMPRA